MMPTGSVSLSLVGRRLACRRGNRRVFDGVDVALERGSITWLRGANGSGKTSLLRILAGLAAPEAGDVQRADKILYVAHANALKDDLTLHEALAFLARLHGVPRAQERAARALEVLGLAPRRKALVRTLSQGQRRRGALARLALDERPRCWLLDEPYDALDTSSMALLSALIERNAAAGGSVLLTSHMPPALRDLRVLELAAGGAS
jgi:heme exporter protein A